jgi:hypothetical protein
LNTRYFILENWIRTSSGKHLLFHLATAFAEANAGGADKVKRHFEGPLILRKPLSRLIKQFICGTACTALMFEAIFDSIPCMERTGETITHEAGNDEAWICICKNTPPREGFYACDEDGNEVVPTAQDWTRGLYVCADCGRIIDPKTLEVVGRNPHRKLFT